MRVILVLLVVTFSVSAETVFVENCDLWAEIDGINLILENADELDSETLEGLFQQTVEIVVSSELSQQFEDLRADAFEHDSFQEIDAYANRAGIAVNVFIMGESNNIGVNVAAFYELSTPDSEANSFFLVCTGGFYAGNNQIGTAELPAWMIRTESSAQAVIDHDQAQEWLSFWTDIQTSLDGYFLEIANHTILNLNQVLLTPKISV